MSRIDGLIERVAPSWAARRQDARAKIAVSGAQEAVANEVKRYADRVARRDGSIFGETTTPNGNGSGYRASYAGGLATRVDPVVPAGDFKDHGIRPWSGPTVAYTRSRARRLVENNNLASALVNSSTDFVIGSGTTIEPTTADEEYNKRAQELWDDYWLGRNGGSPDVRGMCGGPELERLLYAAHIRDGDCGVILLDDGRIQAIESDLIETPDRRDGTVSDGVEVNAVGRPLRFHIRVTDSAKPFERRWSAVNAEDFCFMPRLKRLHQLRGETAFAQSFTLFEQLEGYIDGVVMAARMAAMFGLLIKEAPTAGFTSLPRTTDAQGNQRRIIDMEAAMVKYMRPGEDVVQVRPEQPTTQFDPFVRIAVRLAGLELTLPLEIALLDFSQTTYSSARASMNVAQRTAIAKHALWCERFVSRVYRWRISKWIKDDKLKPPVNDDPWNHQAVQEPFAALDKVQDVKGDMLAVDAGFQTWTEVMGGWSRKRGEQLIAQRKAELEQRRKAGLIFGRPIETRDDPPMETDKVQVKEEIDAYGVAVRAGAITPQIDDEAAIRERFGLPPLSADVKAAWAKEGGTRRPITLSEDKPDEPEDITDLG